MTRYLKSFISLLLIVVCLAAGFTDAFTKAVAEAIQEQAEQNKLAANARPVTETLESNGWQYRVCADGYAELLGYTDTSADTLTLPTALGGTWVVRIAKNGFAENASLTDVFIPAQINEIPNTAFPGNSTLTVRAYNGTAALLFAQKRGLAQKNQSKYDFFDNVLDLSEIKSSQWSIVNHQLTFEAPFSRILSTGTKVYLPKTSAYANGLPVELTSYDASTGTAGYLELNFTEALKSYKAENVQMAPDIAGIQILAYGVELDPSTAKGTVTASAQLPLTFNLNLRLSNSMKLSGSVGYNISLFASVDYGFFKINSFSYKSKTSSFQNINLSKSGKFFEKEAPAKSLKLARVPMVSATLLSVWLELTLVVSAQGEISIKSELTTTEKCTWKNKQMTKSKSESNKKFDISAAASISATVQGSIIVRIGFVAVKTHVEVAALSVSYGWSATVKTSTESLGCADVIISSNLSVSLRIGLLKVETIGKNAMKLGTSLSFGGDLFNVNNVVFKRHFEFSTLKFVDKCTHSKYPVVTYFIGPNDTGITTQSVTAVNGSTISAPTEPSRDGYSFDGWYKDVSFAEPWDFDNDVVTTDITLYAKWISYATGSYDMPVLDSAIEISPDAEPVHLLNAEESLPFLRYRIDDDGAHIIGYNGEPVAITIPDEIEGKKVVSIENPIGEGFGFVGCTSLRQIVLSDNIETMWAGVFAGTSLTSVRTPLSWQEVYDVPSPFGGCTTLKEVIFPEGVTAIPPYAFVSATSPDIDLPTTSIERIILPSTLKEIGYMAFAGTSISSIELPEGLEALSNFVFSDCVKLTSVTLPNSLTTMGSFAFTGTRLTSVQTPTHWSKVAYYNWDDGDYVQGYESPFAGCNTLRSIIVPEGVTALPDYAFSKTGNIDAPSDTSSIVDISLPSTLKKIGTHSFDGTSITSITLPDGITDMSSYAFAGTRLTSVRTPASWSKITPYTDEEEGTIYVSPFAGSSLTQVLVPEGAVSLPKYAFRNASSLKDVFLPDTLTEIGSYAFDGANISSIELPDGLQSIGERAFQRCKKLTSLSLTDSITTMGANAFSGTRLTSVQTPANWTNVEASGKKASPFNGCTTLRNVVVADGAATLPDYAFAADSSSLGIVSIRLPDTLTEIGHYAFKGTAISSIQLPDGLKTIGASAFENCQNLTSITLPDSVTSMGPEAFWGTALTSVQTPLNWTTVSPYEGRTGSPFAGCKTLKSFLVPDGVTMMPDNAFNLRKEYLTAPTYPSMSVSLPNTLVQVGANAFAEMKLSEIVFPSSVASIGTGALAGCTSLKRIVFLGDVSSIGDAIAEGAPVEEVCSPADSSTVRSYFEKNHPSACLAELPSDYHILSWKNSGEHSLPNQTIQAGLKLTRPAAPTYTDHTFEGWYKDEACTQAWDFEVDVMPDADLTLYGCWRYTPSGFSYTVSDGGATITKYEGDAITLIIPREIGGVSVRALAAESIPEEVVSLTIPASVTTIDANAFWEASGLASITVESENEVYRSENDVLYKGSTLVCYPPRKADRVFTIPDGVTSIGEHGFYNCDILHALAIPASVVEIGECGIYDCDTLEQVPFTADVNSIASGNLLLCAENLNVTGPIGAENLTAYADGAYVNYNMYNLIFAQDGKVIGTLPLRAGEKIGELPALESDALVFVGWSVAENEVLLWTDSDASMPANDLVFYAVFENTFRYVQTDGGIILTEYVGTAPRVDIPASIDGQNVLEIRENCFKDTSVTLLGDKGSLAEAYANAQGLNFEKKTYTLRFETNGGTKAADQTLSAGDEFVLPATIRTGYDLKGWYTDEILTDVWAEGNTMPSHDLTLYARWRCVDDSAPIVPFTFDEVEDGLTITGFTGDFSLVEIPETINGQTVTRIADYAFAGNSYIQEVQLPQTVTSIGENAFADTPLYSITMGNVETIGAHAFEGCASLAEVSLPDTLKLIGAYAFQDCTALLNIALPNSITTLEEGLFEGCTWLTSVSLPDELESICSGAFRACAHIGNIHLGTNVNEIAQNVFDGCSALTAFTVEDGNMYYKAVDGVLFNKAGTQLVLYPVGKADSAYTIPEGVTTLADGAMRKSRLITLRLNSELSTIGAGSLNGSALLETIVFNTNLTDIGANAFDGCISLKEVTLPDSVKKVGAEAFDMTGLNHITIPAQTELGKNAIPATDTLTICGKADSEAEIYANAHGIRFLDASRDVEVTGISIPEALNLEPGTSTTLTTVLTPANTTEQSIIWLSADETVAVVTPSGVVEARAVGTTTIVAKAANGSIAECIVTVAKKTVKATQITVSSSEILLFVGEMRSVSATVLPVDADDGAVTWSVSDPKIVSWSNSIVGLTPGKTLLLVTTEGGLTAQCTIIVCSRSMGTPDFKLPSALNVIEAEAFAGLPVSIVACPNGLETIESQAFANCESLAQIYIPATVTKIAPDAFAGSNRYLVIYGKAGTTAEAFAAENGYLFSAVD